MKVTYLHHSGFAVELMHSCLLFDYESGSIPDFPKDKTIYVYVSHIHSDHFNKKIYDLMNDYPSIYFILDKDIPSVAQAYIQFVEPYHAYDVRDCHIETLKSTDEGVAFIVEIEGKRLYHAGDLNWWDWGEEDTPAESKAMEMAYKSELTRIQDVHFDIAFVPVDPRLKKAFHKGLQTFLEYCFTDYIIPMHFWDDYSIFEKMKELPYYDKILDIQTKNQIFQL